MIKKKSNLLTTGLSLVDKTWGGFYRGGSYLLIGQKKTGRTLAGLHFAMESAKNRQVCLYFTNMRPKDLMIHASSIDFDLQTYMNQNLVIVVRVAPPTELSEVPNPDHLLVEYLNDIVTVVEQYQPQRLVFDELTHFVGFEDNNLLQQTYLETIEKIEDQNTTSLFILADPVTPLAQMIVDSLAQYSTGVIFLQRKDDDGGPFSSGRATITPNIGHTEGQFISDYHIEPYKGLVFDYEKETVKYQNPFSISGGIDPNSVPPPTTRSNKYKPITNVDLVADKMSFTNLYDLSEFTLILNNQIALFKSTGQQFNLLALKLDPIAEQQKILTINQLQNAVRLSTDKKDKLCVVKNKILVLVGSSDEKALNIVVSKLKDNFPNNDPSYVDLVMRYIFAFSYSANDSVQNAETLLKEILEDEPTY